MEGLVAIVSAIFNLNSMYVTYFDVLLAVS